MKFERNNDVLDTLTIGRYANALKIDSIVIKYESYVADADYVHGETDINGLSLIPFLRHLVRDGLDYNFHQWIQEKLIEKMTEYKIDQKYIDRLEISGVAFKYYPEGSEKWDIKTIVDMFGKDVLYMNRLYKIKNDPNF